MDSISDPQKLAAYGKLAIPAVAPFCARMLARGNAVAAYENGLKERVTIIEYAREYPPRPLQPTGGSVARMTR